MASRGPKQVVVVGARLGKEYDGIRQGSLVFSPDNRRVAYAATKAQSEVVVVDYEEGPQYSEIIVPPVFSPDGKHVGYAAKRGETCMVVLNGEEGPRYDGIGEYSLVFSPNSKRVAYGAAKGSKWVAIVDGTEGTHYEGIAKGSLAFSPDSEHVAYLAFKQSEKLGRFLHAPARMKHLVVLDGHEGPLYDKIVKGGPAFHQNGTLEYLAEKEGGLYRVRHSWQ